jgi:hypothetical protein
MAARRLDDHVALQRKLQPSGFLAATETADGVYRATTRTAMSARQRASNWRNTGCLKSRLERDRLLLSLHVPIDGRFARIVGMALRDAHK